MKRATISLCLFFLVAAGGGLRAQDKNALEPMDVFRLEYATDPQIAPDGKQVVYVRNFMDIKKDRRRSNLWIINVDGSEHRPLTSSDGNERMPRWSPDSKRLLYLAADNELMCRWMEHGNVGRLAKLPGEPLGIAWSPDSKMIAFTMHVAAVNKPFVQLPTPPKGAEWADPPVMIRSLNYRLDGKGYLKEGHHHLFVLPADGGTPRQLTTGPHDHVGTPAWTPDGKTLLITANRHPEGGHDPLNTEIYVVTLADGAIKALTKRKGPDNNPVVSPDGKQIAYTGFDDKQQGYQVTRLYVMNRDGSSPRLFPMEKLDRDVKNQLWSKNGELFFQFDDEGNTKVATTKFPEILADNIGGTTLDRPYASGSFSVSDDGTIAFTQTSPSHPAEVAVRAAKDKQPRRLTNLSNSLLGQKKLASVEEIRYKSSHDGREIHGWIVKPAGFDPKKKYLSPSTVYRILKGARLVQPWRRRSKRRREEEEKAKRPNERWATDLMYLQIGGRTYFFVTFLDEYSRYIVHHELLTSMDGFSVSLSAQGAIETLPKGGDGKPVERPEIRTDNGSGYISQEFRLVLKENGLAQQRIKPHCPEENGLVERSNRTIREALEGEDLTDPLEAKRILARIIRRYNEERLHSALGFLRPVDYYRGNPKAMHEARRQKLSQARHRRKEANLGLKQGTLPY